MRFPVSPTDSAQPKENKPTDWFGNLFWGGMYCLLIYSALVRCVDITSPDLQARYLEWSRIILVLIFAIPIIFMKTKMSGWAFLGGEVVLFSALFYVGSLMKSKDITIIGFLILAIVGLCMLCIWSQRLEEKYFWPWLRRKLEKE